jgi:hypothetical protein
MKEELIKKLVQIQLTMEVFTLANITEMQSIELTVKYMIP